MRKTGALACVIAIGVAAPGVAAPSMQTVAIDARFDTLVRSAQLPLAALIVFDETQMLYQRLTPDFDANTAIPIASASKWVAAALIMTGVDRGEMSLEEPVGKLIPEALPLLRNATLRQLLSHTSGMAGRALANMGPVASLEASVVKLFSEPLARAPGSAFAYGGASMQVAGLMLERAARRPYADLMRERITGPLGMATARVGSPRSWGTGEVPWVAGGMAMSLDDYRRFLAMMLGNGQVDGRRILSERSVAAIETNAIAGIPIAYRPQAAANDAGYGLGIWCEEVARDGRCGRVSSAGAFGAYPWIDRAKGRAGIFLTQSSLPKVHDGIVGLRDATTPLSSPSGAR